MAESDWVEFDLRESYSYIPIKDQDGIGACNGHAAATSLEWARAIAGYEFVELSPWYIYSILCGGVDRGSSISEALTLLTKDGTCPFSDVPYGVYNPRKLSQQAHDNARRFRLEIGSPLSNFAEIMTATQLRRPGNFSICVGSNFNDLDADGCPPVSRGPGNHAVTFGVGAKKGRGGRWLIISQNSWTRDWGQGGYFNISSDHTDRQPYYESYDVVAVGSDPQDPNRPPIVVG
jgi:hypothetical protein